MPDAVISSSLCFRPWSVTVKFCNTGSVILYEVQLFYFPPHFLSKQEIKIRLFCFVNFAFSSLLVVCFQDGVASKFTYPVGIILILMPVFSLNIMHISEFFLFPNSFYQVHFVAWYLGLHPGLSDFSFLLILVKH